NREVMSRRLQKQGYKIVLASSGHEALEILRQQTIDLILLDVMMPGMSGLQVLEVVRATHSALELPVIMVTAKGASEDVVAALQRGANDYAAKPLDFPVIFARIQTHLGMRTAHLSGRQAASAREQQAEPRTHRTAAVARESAPVVPQHQHIPMAKPV